MEPGVSQNKRGVSDSPDTPGGTWSSLETPHVRIWSPELQDKWIRVVLSHRVYASLSKNKMPGPGYTIKDRTPNYHLQCTSGRHKTGGRAHEYAFCGVDWSARGTHSRTGRPRVQEHPHCSWSTTTNKKGPLGLVRWPFRGSAHLPPSLPVIQIHSIYTVRGENRTYSCKLFSGQHVSTRPCAYTAISKSSESG